MKLFLRVEQGFDKLFNYKPQQTETYDYLNAMKNSPVAEQLELQEQDVQYNERKIEINQEGLLLPIFKTNNQVFNIDTKISTKQNIYSHTS